MLYEPRGGYIHLHSSFRPRALRCFLLIRWWSRRQNLRKKLPTAWIDYKKAFDSVPRSWIRRTLGAHKVCPTTVRFTSESMKSWKTNLHLRHASGSLTSRPIKIMSGIFLLFCIALAPLS